VPELKKFRAKSLYTLETLIEDYCRIFTYLQSQEVSGLSIVDNRLHALLAGKINIANLVSGDSREMFAHFQSLLTKFQVLFVSGLKSQSGARVALWHSFEAFLIALRRGVEIQRKKASTVRPFVLLLSLSDSQAARGFLIHIFHHFSWHFFYHQFRIN